MDHVPTSCPISAIYEYPRFWEWVSPASTLGRSLCPLSLVLGSLSGEFQPMGARNFPGQGTDLQVMAHHSHLLPHSVQNDRRQARTRDRLGRSLGNMWSETSECPSQAHFYTPLSLTIPRLSLCVLQTWEHVWTVWVFQTNIPHTMLEYGVDG